jgi:hypothetical protein
MYITPCPPLILKGLRLGILPDGLALGHQLILIDSFLQRNVFAIRAFNLDVRTIKVLLLFSLLVRVRFNFTEAGCQKKQNITSQRT